MDITAAILGRRSIRAFSPEPVDEQVVSSVLDDARWAPSWGNAQDWNVWAVTGDALERIKTAYTRRIQEGGPSITDLEMPTREQWPERMLARMNLTRPGETFRPPPGPSIWEMYGAPCLLLFAIDDGLVPEYACFDAGLLVENVCLAAHAAGLGTVIMAMAVRYPEILRDVVPGTEGKRFVVGVALGHPAPGSPGNEQVRQRAGLDDLVAWVR